MPLYKDIAVSDTTRILIWKVTEAIEELQHNNFINASNILRLAGMKSESHKRAFLSVRRLLAVAGYSDADLFYDENGKPNLRDGKHISITHSHQFAAIVISDVTFGIDIELARDKILRIANKFAATEDHYLKDETIENQILKLTVIWGIKESIFKIRNEPGISFKDHISVPNFELSSKKAIGNLHFGNLNVEFCIEFEIIEDFVLVWACNTNES